MGDITLIVWLAIYAYRLDIDILITYILCLDNKSLSISQVHLDFRENR